MSRFICGNIWLAEHDIIMANVRDVTERKRTEMERERLLAELDTTISSIANGVVIYDTAGNIVRMNQAVEDILNLSPEQRRMPYPERIASRHALTPEGRPFPLNESPLYRALLGETVQGVIILFPGKKGPRWISADAAPIRTPTGEILGVVGTFTDITGVHDAQVQMREMLRLISHDLRAPLAVIQGHAQVLREDAEQEHLAADYLYGLDAILRGAQRLNTMIQDLVEVARLEGGQTRLQTTAVNLPGYITDLLARIATVLDTARIHCEIRRSPAGTG